MNKENHWILSWDLFFRPAIINKTTAKMIIRQPKIFEMVNSSCRNRAPQITLPIGSNKQKIEAVDEPRSSIPFWSRTTARKEVIIAMMIIVR